MPTTIHDIICVALDEFQRWLSFTPNASKDEVENCIDSLADDLTPSLDRKIVEVANSYPTLFRCYEDTYPYF